MAYEFKKLSEAEVVETPADTANVLIEEDGVIKKTPKTAVGGAGVEAGVEADMVIYVRQSSAGSIEVTSDNYTIGEGSVDAVFDAIREGRPPVVKVRYKSSNLSAYTAMVNDYTAYVYTYGEGLWIKYIATTWESSNSWYGCFMAINSDGSLDSFISYVF